MNQIFYLAAPYSGSEEEVENRMRQLCIADAVLMKNGIFTMSPLMKHFIINYESLPGDWNYWKNYSEVLLSKADGMIVLKLDGWEQSTGVQAEIEICKKNNILIFFFTYEEILNGTFKTFL
jgi:hypothetical protein